jgi:hypothetical protein
MLLQRLKAKIRREDEIRQLQKRVKRLRAENERLRAAGKAHGVREGPPATIEPTVFFSAGCYAGTGPSGRRFVYVQVPKAACTSVKQALLPAFGINCPEDGPAVHRVLRKSPARIAKRKLATPDLADLYRFSFVRNPFDRLVSAYYSKISEHRTVLSNEQFRGGMSFEEFAEAACEIPDESADQHVRSQWTFLDGVRMDFVGRLENMGEDYARVAGVLGVSPILPHSNHATRPHDKKSYRNHYDEELARKVGERYRGDLEAFGYSF